MTESGPSFWQQKWMESEEKRQQEGHELRERALKILETSQKEALDLARQAQQYRDEQANNLREQINSERGVYATKDDLQASEDKLEALIKPLTTALQQSVGSSITRSQLLAGVVVIIAALGLWVAIANGRI